MKLQIGKATTTRVSTENLVRRTSTHEGRLHVITATGASDLAEWIAHNKAEVETLHAQTGALLFRGFSVPTEAEFAPVVKAFSGGTPYMIEDQNSHNQFVTDGEDVWFHNDYCDRAKWPRYLIFWCELTNASGGETPFVDTTRVYQQLPARIRDRFEAEGWILQRRFHPGIGVDAKGYFKTDDTGEILRQLALLDAFDVRWDGDVLTGFSVRFAPSFEHPALGIKVWGNNITFSNIAMVEQTIREQLLSDYATDELPVNTFWGDGTPISARDMATLRDIYLANEVSFEWQEGDVLLIDNIRCVHGRRPILAPQRVNVGVCEFYDRVNALALS
ncbi:TauD/TfdA family dioxygenase [Streptomyces sp. NRRL S-920]|uniref:TauD/TfdA family dioxygenase n=1 Tax=Streptomyces sp. NRRL S-920 TaxID=1463921 RepID=UPI0004C87626|nr:TauD/TfdA family dioxygenase [Streptomyces sp. NRRL S-920]